MAPHRRGKNGPKNRSTVLKNASATRGQGRRGGLTATESASSNVFQASRVQELSEDLIDGPDGNTATDFPGSDLDEPLSHDDISGSDEVHEHPYNFLLQTLNPTLPHNEPRRKRRKISSDTPTVSTQGPPSKFQQAVEDIEDEGELSEEDSADDSDIAELQQGECSVNERKILCLRLKSKTLSQDTSPTQMTTRLCPGYKLYNAMTGP